jgi:hypothetical protein
MLLRILKKKAIRLQDCANTVINMQFTPSKRSNHDASSNKVAVINITGTPR